MNFAWALVWPGNGSQSRGAGTLGGPGRGGRAFLDWGSSEVDERGAVCVTVTLTVAHRGGSRDDPARLTPRGSKGSPSDILESSSGVAEPPF